MERRKEGMEGASEREREREREREYERGGGDRKGDFLFGHG